MFDGTKGAPYVESDSPSPLNAYGRAKAEAERLVLEHAPGALVVRSAAFFGPWDRYNFVTLAVDALRRGEPWAAAADQCVSPTYVPDLVQATLDLLVDGERGVWHLTNRGEVSWADLARMAAHAASLDPRLVQDRASAELGMVAPRPRYSALASERGALMPKLDDALCRYITDCQEKGGNWPWRGEEQKRAA